MKKENKKGFKNISKKLWFRITIAIAAPSIVVFGLLYLYYFGNPFICIFHYFTGLYTAGCGTGRALSSLLRLDILKAIKYNIGFVIILPLISYFLIATYFKIVTLEDIIPPLNISSKKGIILGVSIFLYAILRNIPIFPFSWLAPG